MAKLLDIRDVALDAPLRLSIAAKLAFPDGSMTPSGLRKEAVRGRLIIERIAGKDFTTLEHINLMRELCRVERRAPDSGYGQSAETLGVKSRLKPFGSSSTAPSTSPQDALRAKLQLRKQSSQATSRQNISPPDAAKTSKTSTSRT